MRFIAISAFAAICFGIWSPCQARAPDFFSPELTMEVERICKVTGLLTLRGDPDKPEALVIRVLCDEKRDGKVHQSLGDDIVMPRGKDGLYRTKRYPNAYFFMRDGRPAVSFLTDEGKRFNAKLRALDEAGMWSFRPYLQQLKH